jgi:hypothetical protein
MTSELDDFLKNLENEDKKIEKQNHADRKRANEFVRLFKNLLHDLIHPTMITVLAKLRHSGLWGSVVMNEIFFDSPHETYQIRHGAKNGIILRLSVVANSQKEKVCIVTQFLKKVADQVHNQWVEKIILQTQEEFQPSEINVAMLEKAVMESIKQARSL